MLRNLVIFFFMSQTASAQTTADLSKIIAIQQVEISRLKEKLTTAEIQEVSGNHSCAAIKQKNPQAKDGVYSIIHPSDLTRSYKAYCDMTTQGGGWTLVDSVGTVGEMIKVRVPIGGTTPDPTITAGRYLPFYFWTGDAQLLCRSSLYTGTKDWITLRAQDTIPKEYPTQTTTTAEHSNVGWAVKELNGNTFRGLTSWIVKDSTHSGTVWIGHGNRPTCACGYDTTAGQSGLGEYSDAKSTCSTWVR